MRVCRLVDLASWIDGRSVAIVGNAPSLLTSTLGPRIDACDVVIRTNNYLLKDEWREHVGTRIDGYLCSFWYGHDKITKSADDIRRHSHVICPFPDVGESRQARHQFAASLMGDRDVHVPTTEELEGVRAYIRDAIPTTGFLGVYLLLKSFTPASVLMCGFDCFADITRVHYYESGGHCGFSHNSDQEKAAFLRLAREYPALNWHEASAAKDRVTSPGTKPPAGEVVPRRVYVRKTDVCRRREPDHWRLREYFARNGHTLVAAPADADCVVLDTCSSNGRTEDDSMRAVEELAQTGKDMVVVGCLPRVAGNRLAGVFEGKTACHGEWNKLDSWFRISTGYQEVEQSLSRLPVATHCSEAFGQPGTCWQIQVSRGCTDCCTYCGDKAAVGAIRSRPLDELLADARSALDSGASYLALVGDDVGAVGMDRGYTVFDLLEQVVAIPGDYTLDLYDVSPKHLVRDLPRLGRILASGHFGELTIAWESASDRVLQIMNRGYTCGEIRALAGLLHANRVGVHGHILVGMPGETDAEFEESLRLVTELQCEGVTFFAYQDIPRTPAYRLPEKIAPATIRARMCRAAERLALNDYEITPYQDHMQCYRVAEEAPAKRREASSLVEVRRQRADAANRFKRATEMVASAGLSRIVVYGTGQHTRRLARLLAACPLDLLGFIDDAVEGADATYLGRPVMNLRAALSLSPDAIIFSTDRYERDLAARLRAQLPQGGVALVTLYEDGAPRMERGRAVSVAP